MPADARAPVPPALEARALQGDRVAWDQLIARHHQRVVVSLLARGIPLPRAHELAQDTWERLIVQQRAGKLKELTFPGLAIRQATFLALDEHRRRRPDVYLDDEDNHIELRDDSDPDRLMHRDQLRRARAGLQRCSPRARQIFEAIYSRNLSHAEAAAELGLSVQRVRQTLCEVRKKLRAAIEEEQTA